MVLTTLWSHVLGFPPTLEVEAEATHCYYTLYTLFMESMKDQILTYFFRLSISSNPLCSVFG